MNKRQAKYWICDDCAVTKRLIEKDKANTKIKGLCGYCDRKDESLLTSIMDFDKRKYENAKE